MKAIEIGKEIINEFETIYKNKWLNMMKKKLGFVDDKKNDDILIKKLLIWMENNKVDYTNTFIYLMNDTMIIDKKYENDSFKSIKEDINKRKLNNFNNKKEKINLYNPLIIPRNHIVEEALSLIENEGNYQKFDNLLNAIKEPYQEGKDTKDFQKIPDPLFEKSYQTYCGT